MALTLIAEPGCTAEGDLSRQIDLVHLAAEAGATHFKAQWTSNAELLAERRGASDYAEYYRWLQVPIEVLEQIRDACVKAEIQFACSVYLPGDVRKVVDLVDAVKIASFEAKDRAMLTTLRHTECDVRPFESWISTGMCSGSDLLYITAHGPREPVLFHCVSAYPAPLEDLNLAVLNGVEGWPPLRGFSDHVGSSCLYSGALAVAAGADYLETHVRLVGADPENPDVPHALRFDEYAVYVALAKAAELARGNGVKAPQPSEQAMAEYRVVEGQSSVKMAGSYPQDAFRDVFSEFTD